MLKDLGVRQNYQLTSCCHFQIHFVQIFAHLMVEEVVEVTIEVNCNPGFKAISCSVSFEHHEYFARGQLRSCHFRMLVTLRGALFEQCF
jgi:hypothetical protein